MSIGRRFYTDNTVSSYPSRVVTFTPSINDAANVVTYDLNFVGLEDGITLNYEFLNATTSDFVEGTKTGSITVSSNSASITRTLAQRTNYSTSNLVISLLLTSPTSGANVAQGGNVIIAPITPIQLAYTGPYTIVNSGGNVIWNLTGNGNLTVSNLGDTPEYNVIRQLIVGGGGAGDYGFSNYQSTPYVLPYPPTTHLGGGGGGGGGVIQANVLANTFSVGTYSVTVGAGGIAYQTESLYTIADQHNVAQNGGNTSFNGYVAIGGGGGWSQNGGSGGGATHEASPANLSVGGTGTSGQGFAGGARLQGRRIDPSFEEPYYLTFGGGGGGAATVGGNAVLTGNLSGGTYRPPITSARGGNGGEGIISNIFGTPYVFGSGGGGGGGAAVTNGGNVTPGGLGGTNAGNGGGKQSDESSRFTARGQDAIVGYGGGGGGAGHWNVGIIPPGGGPERFNARVRGGSGSRGTVAIAYEKNVRVFKYQT